MLLALVQVFWSLTNLGSFPCILGQFFICTVDTPWLDGRHCVFGKVVGKWNFITRNAFTVGLESRRDLIDVFICLGVLRWIGSCRQDRECRLSKWEDGQEGCHQGLRRALKKSRPPSISIKYCPFLFNLQLLVPIACNFDQ